MHAKAKAILRKDPKLRKIIDSHPIVLTARKDYFKVLVMSIVYQQLSGASAGAIFGRLMKECRITPVNIAKLKPSRMRKAGLSRQKIAYLKDLSGRFIDNKISPRKFHSQTDEEVLEELVAVKGIGRWTAEMFLMFSLAREDVFPADDLGIKRAIGRLYGVRDLSQKNLDRFSARWKPYRTYASLCLWQSADSKPPKNW